jgi:methylaspartate ammonia-lyase
MKIVEVIAVPVRSGFFSDDQEAIRAGAIHDGFGYRGEPVTKGFENIRQPGEALSVMLVLDDGSVAFGDCAAVQYSGVGGRDAVFSAERAKVEVDTYVAPILTGVTLCTFRSSAEEIDTFESAQGRLSQGVRYGVTQALLAAVSTARRVTMAEVICDEYNTGSLLQPVPLYAQTGDERVINADKMILKGVDVIPHALINNLETGLGHRGELLEKYLRWLVQRIAELRPAGDYRPRLHIDTYGTIGIAFDHDAERIARYLKHLGEICAPLELTVEHPIDAGGTDAQVKAYVGLRRELARIGASIRIAVDEWCNTLEDVRKFVEAEAADIIHVKMPDLGGINNTIEALLLVRAAGMDAYCGGSCNETDRSAQISAHVAMACEASQILAKPGMGVDEGLMIVGNEMARTVAIVAARTS